MYLGYICIELRSFANLLTQLPSGVMYLLRMQSVVPVLVGTRLVVKYIPTY